MTRIILLLAGLFVVHFSGPVALSQTRSGGTPASGVRVSGSVVKIHPDAVPAPTEVLMHTPVEDRWPPGPMLRAPILANGTFVFQDVPPGNYELGLNPVVHEERLSIAVDGTDLTGLRLTAVGRPQLIPRVRLDDGSALPPDRLIGFRVPIGSEGPYSWLSRPVSVPPGKRFVFVVPPDGYFVVSATAGGVDLLREPLDTAPAAPDRDFEVVLSRTRPADIPTATLTGRITGDHPGVEVELVNVTKFGSPQDRNIAGTTKAGPDGTFEFRNLPYGVYDIGLPPAQRVVRGLVVAGGESRIEIPVPPGTLFAGGYVFVFDRGGRQVSEWRGKLSMVAEANGQRTVFAIDRLGFWGTLPPGAYHVTIEGLSPGFTVRSLSAGSANLLVSPFIVPPNRPAETVNLVLQYDPAPASR